MGSSEGIRGWYLGVSFAPGVPLKNRGVEPEATVGLEEWCCVKGDFSRERERLRGERCLEEWRREDERLDEDS